MGWKATFYKPIQINDHLAYALLKRAQAKLREKPWSTEEKAKAKGQQAIDEAWKEMNDPSTLKPNIHVSAIEVKG